MSTIDERIVEMQFNNKQFEDGVRTTLKSITDLKTGLNFDGATQSLSELEKAGRSFSLANMVESVEQISNRFSTLGIVGMSVLYNLTNAAMNFGKRMVSALTIDPLKTGFNEYETKINAIQTILTNTASKGVTIKEVNEVLNELNEYADKTIYNFAEMTRNIGTFTAAGVGLRESAIAIKGIANLAAGSGSTAQQAATAMYQLSQALAAGTVKLMDWNSVVNAGMGGELFQNALKETAKEMGIVVDTTKSFRDSLQDGWVTSEVLIKTLTKFAEDEMLVKAATQVKTFTQLFDTMKESVQSGWAISWEYIVGDKEESTKLLTSISDAFNSIIGASSDARNEILAFWKANGGRDAIIEGLTSAFKGLISVLKPIREAFREVFEPITGETLIVLSNNVKNLFSKFKMGETSSENLKNAFKGLFSAVDIGLTVLVEFLKGISKFIGWLAPIGSGILSIAGNIGKLVSSLRDTIKTSESLEKFIKSVKELFRPVVDGVQSMLLAITDGLTSLTEFDTGELESFSERLRKIFVPIMAIGEGIRNALMSISPYLSKASSVIISTLSKLADKVANEIKDIDFNNLVTILNGVLFANVLNSINKFIKKLGEITDNGAGIIDNIRDILGGVGEALQSYQKNLQANTLLTIASSIGILAASLIALSMIDTAKLEQALQTLSALFVEMFAASGLFGKILSGSKIINSIGTIATIQGLAIAVLILAKALDEVASLDWGSLTKGIVAVSAMVTMVTLAIKNISGNTAGLTASSIGLIAFAASIRILIGAVEKLSDLDIPGLTKGLVGIGVLLTEISLFMKTTDFGKMGVFDSAAIIGIATAMNIFANAVSKFGDLDIVQISKGLGAMGIVLAEIAGFMKIITGSTGIMSAAIGMTIISTSMLLFGESVAKIGSMPIGTIVKGLGAMATTLVAIAGAMKLMPSNILLTATGLTVVSGALLALSISLRSLGNMSVAEIGKSILALSSSLTVLAGAMKLMTTGLPGAAAMTVMAGAIAIFAPSLMLLSTIPFKGILAGLTAIAGAFTVMGIAGSVLTPLIPAILGLSAGLALLGAGMLAIGGGVTLFATGIAILATNLGIFVKALAQAAKDIVTLIPDILKIIGETFKGVAKIIGESAPEIVKSIVVLLEALIDAIKKSAPKVLDLFFDLVIDILRRLDNTVPEIVKRGLNIMIGFLRGLSEKLPELIKVGGDIIVNFLKGISSKIPEIVESAITVVTSFLESVAKQIGKVIQSGFNLMVSFINGLADGIRKNTDIMITSMENLMSAIVEAGIKVLKASIENFIKIGRDIVNGLIEGIKSMISSVAKAVGNVADTVIDTAKDVLGIRSPSKVFEEEIGEKIGEGLAKGIRSSSQEAIDESANMSEAVVDTSKEAFQKFLDWIDERKYYNELSLAEELEAWQKMQEQYLEGTEERKRADREAYRVKQEIRRLDEEYAWKIQQVEQQAAEERIRIDEEYYAKTKEINDKLKADIRALNDEYDRAVESRTQALYKSYGLFDKVDEKDPINGQELIQNLEDQVEHFESWQQNITKLAQKGIDEGLLEELRKMGPQAAAQIAALNALSEEELNTYVSLWQTKHNLAKTQAINELEGMRLETVNKIKELKEDANIALEEARIAWEYKIQQLTIETEREIDELKQEWVEKVYNIRTETEVQFDELRTNIKDSVTNMRTETEQEFTTLAENIQNIMKKPDWYSLGANIIRGIAKGIRDHAELLVEAASDAAEGALEAAEDTLGIESPSKEFARLGMYADQGFAAGLSKFAKIVTSSAKDVGKSAIYSLQNAISNISTVFDDSIDISPVIRPILDMSEVESGAQRIVHMLNKNIGINTSSINGKIPIIRPNGFAEEPDNPLASNKPQGDIKFIQNNYSPKALSRLEIYRQTRMQLLQMKGLMRSI